MIEIVEVDQIARRLVISMKIKGRMCTTGLMISQSVLNRGVCSFRLLFLLFEMNRTSAASNFVTTKLR